MLVQKFVRFCRFQCTASNDQRIITPASSPPHPDPWIFREFVSFNLGVNHDSLVEVSVDEDFGCINAPPYKGPPVRRSTVHYSHWCRIITATDQEDASHQISLHFLPQ